MKMMSSYSQLYNTFWYSALNENDRLSVRICMEMYHSKYDTLQYSLIDAIKADDISLVERVLSVQDYLPIRTRGLIFFAQSTGMQECIDKAISTLPAIRVSHVLHCPRYTRDKYENLISLYKRNLACSDKKPTTSDSLIGNSSYCEAIHYDIIHLYQNPIQYYDVDECQSVSINPEDVIVEMVQKEYTLSMPYYKYHHTEYLQNCNVLNRVSAILIERLHDGYKVEYSLSLCIDFGLVELIDRYATWDNMYDVYAQLQYRIGNAFSLDILDRLALHPEWYNYSISETMSQHSPSRFQSILLDRAILAGNTNLINSITRSI